MAARGTEAKNRIFKKLLEVFPGSFMQDEKVLRIIESEDGSTVEIKVSLTAAKDILGSEVASTQTFDWETPTAEPNITAAAQPSEDEKARIAKMMAALGM